MKITSFKKGNKVKGTLLVYIDGEYAFSILEEEYFSLGLYEEKEITKEEIEYIQKCILFKRAKSDALRYISFKKRTSRETALKLEYLGYDNSIVKDVIKELIDLNYLNDKEYAKIFLENRKRLKPKSKKMLLSELKNKGIKEDIINELLYLIEFDEYKIAKMLVRKKFIKLDTLDEKLIKKIYYFLSSRGFSFELIQKIIREIKEQC